MSNTLQLKPVEELLDTDYFIPYYQRGYRWTNLQVTQLLDDLWEYAKANERNSAGDNYFYCLQPVVIKPKSWLKNGHSFDGFEVIDGQQRLTTVYIILKYLKKEFLKVESLKDDFHKELFTIEYETREDSRDFLQDIRKDFSNIDYYYIYNAYATIQEWFENEERAMNRRDKDLFLNTLLGKKTDISSVQVIWYEVKRNGEDEDSDDKDSKQLFNRLNLGKIPLTNAELIKALFLASDKFKEEGEEEAIKKKIVISQLWDIMEQKLNNPDFWAFITNDPQDDYETKIEFLFNIIANKNKNEKDFYFTFLHFLKISNNSTELWDTWRKVEHYFNILSEWFSNKNQFHKIGYLIATGSNVKSLLDKALKLTKKDFSVFVDEEISKSINFEIESLDYTVSSQKAKINTLLLLFNVETTRKLKNDITYYPFQLHKRYNWSVEHIQAQNSESFNSNKKQPWLDWLALHKPMLMTMNSENANEEIPKTIEKMKKLTEENITWDNFQTMFKEVITYFILSTENGDNSLHEISNLALLTDTDNSALNNSVFQVKQQRLMEMDKDGNYIPICTKRLFLKYYSNQNVLHSNKFWTGQDRRNYLIEMFGTLEEYLNDTNTQFFKNLIAPKND